MAFVPHIIFLTITLYHQIHSQTLLKNSTFNFIIISRLPDWPKRTFFNKNISTLKHTHQERHTWNSLAFEKNLSHFQRTIPFENTYIQRSSKRLQNAQSMTGYFLIPWRNTLLYFKRRILYYLVRHSSYFYNSNNHFTYTQLLLPLPPSAFLILLLF